MTRYSFAFLLVSVLVLSACGGGNEDATSSASEMAEGHEGDTPTPTEAAREPSIPVGAQEVTYATIDGEEVTGYLAVPSSPDSVMSAHGRNPASARLPGLVVIHEWWGINDNIRTATRRLAGEGVRALAVDLYDDSTAQTPDQAQSLMQQATSNTDRLLTNLHRGQEYLRSEAGAPRVGVLGWCFGGSMTFQAVANRPTAFDAAIAYYGSPEPMSKSILQKMTTPVLAHFGRQDEVVSTKQVKALQSRLDGLDVNAQVYQYDAGHAFANPSGENYDPDAASTAWDRTTRFLRSHLHPDAPQK